MTTAALVARGSTTTTEELAAVEVGAVLGAWTVLAPGPPRRQRRRTWFCRCACGTQRVVREERLHNGASRSCGCAWRSRARTTMLEPGTVIGKWTILADAEKTTAGHAAARCRCACGTVRVVTASSLRRGKSLSCGCRPKARPARSVQPPPRVNGLGETLRVRPCLRCSRPRLSSKAQRLCRACAETETVYL
jgi:hypothetical protein